MQVMQKSNSRENYLDLHGEKKPTFSYDRNSAGKMYSSMEMNEDFAREAVRDIRDGKEMRTTHHGRINEFDFNRRMKESASNDRVPMYGKRLDRRQREPSDFGDVGEKFTLTKSSESRPSNFPVKHNDFFPLEERKASRQAIKVSFNFAADHFFISKFHVRNYNFSVVYRKLMHMGKRDSLMLIMIRLKYLPFQQMK